MYNGFYNPMLNAQQRLNQMEQQYPQFANNNLMYQNPQPMQSQIQPMNNILKVGLLQVLMKQKQQ